VHFVEVLGGGRVKSQESGDTPHILRTHEILIMKVSLRLLVIHKKLEKNGIFTKEEFLAMVRVINQEMKKKRKE